MSTRPIANKLLIKPNAAIWTSDASRLDLLRPLPEGVRLVDELDQASVALVFAADAASLRGILAEHRDRLSSPSVLWVAYPKANRADINRDSLWPIVAEYGLRPISQIAVDDVWSALRFRPYREGEAPFTGGRQE